MELIIRSSVKFEGWRQYPYLLVVRQVVFAKICFIHREVIDKTSQSRVKIDHTAPIALNYLRQLRIDTLDVGVAHGRSLTATKITRNEFG